MKFSFLLIFSSLILFACDSSVSPVNELPNPFNSEFRIDGSKTELNGTANIESLSSSFNIISAVTDCDDPKTCLNVEIYLQHDFDESLVLTKNYETDPTDMTDIMLWPNGKCAIPFSADIGTIEVNKSEDGSISGNFNIESSEINGYKPDSRLGCSEEHYASSGTRTLTFSGSFKALPEEN